MTSVVVAGAGGLSAGAAWLALPTGRRPPGPSRARVARLRGAGPVFGAAAVVLAAGVLVGPLAGVVLILPAALALGRRARPVDEQVQPCELAHACVLIAAAVSAGCPVPQAVSVVTTTIGGTAGRELADSAPHPDAAQRPYLARMREALDAARCGVSPVEALRATASAIGADVAAAHAEDARRAGVRVVAPLGLCFLPAFVLVAVVPLVAQALPGIGAAPT